MFWKFSAVVLVFQQQQQKFKHGSVKQLVNCLADAFTQNKEHHVRRPRLSKSAKTQEIQLSIIGLNFLAFIWIADSHRRPKLPPLIKSNPSSGRSIY